MNWVLILVIAILAGYTLTGYTKGFLKIAYSLVSWIVILVFVIFATPHIQDYLRNNTSIYNKVVEYCEETVHESIEHERQENSDGAADLAENETFAAIAQRLPEGILEELKERAGEITDGFMEDYGIYDKTAAALADLLLQGIATLIAMLAGLVVSAALSAVLGFIAKLPLIGFANKILGLAAGAANGLLIVWFAFYLVAVLCTTGFGSAVIMHIYSNEFLTYLYENNIVLNILT